MTVTSAQIDSCPIGSLNPGHYRDAGSCLHFSPSGKPIDAKVARALGQYEFMRGRASRALKAAARVTEANRVLADMIVAMNQEQVGIYTEAAYEIAEHD